MMTKHPIPQQLEHRSGDTQSPQVDSASAGASSASVTHQLSPSASSAIISLASTTQSARPNTIDGVMRFLFPPLGQFRSDAQKAMVEAIYKNKKPGAVFVLPTAGGKSLAYIVPCLCDPVLSMTIAIIPFIAVKDEAFVNAHRAGIHAVDYKPGFQASVPLLMLSAEYISAGILVISL
jgi:hypothetical protein